MINFSDEDKFLVTGASSGIGKEIALRLNELGATIVAIGRNEERLLLAKEQAKFPSKFVFELKDLSSNIELLTTWVYEIAGKYGKFNGFVLSAGIQQTIPLKAITFEKSKSLFDTNYFSNILMCKAFCNKKVYNQNFPSILFISSIAAISGNAGIIDYSASKGAINSAVKSMAVELARQNIRVNAILPGFVMTEMIKNWEETHTKEYIEAIDKKYPLGIGRPEYISDVACFLLSKNARWITGQSIVVDGGGSL